MQHLMDASDVPISLSAPIFHTSSVICCSPPDVTAGHAGDAAAFYRREEVNGKIKGNAKKLMVPEDKAEQKAQRVAADKARKKKLNAPARIAKIQVSSSSLQQRSGGPGRFGT